MKLLGGTSHNLAWACLYTNHMKPVMLFSRSCLGEMEGGTMVCCRVYLFNSWLDFSQKSSSIVIWKQFLKPNTEMQLQKSSFDFI